VGAGLSGIGAAHHLRSECGWARYAILEARGAIGGTWDLFRYPGIRSDSDMFTLGYAFRPWRGAKAIADGGDILEYIRDIAVDEGIDRHIRFHHRVVRAEWSTDEARWHVTAERADGHDGSTPETVELTCSFLLSCAGYYRYDRGHLPDFTGMDDYSGTLIHPQHWPEELDVAGRRVVVIGSGATAVTLVPALAQAGAQVTMLQRSPGYIVSVPARNPIADLLRRRLPERISSPAIRAMHALGTQGMYRLSRSRPQLVRKVLRRQLERELPEGFDIDTHFTPHYDPWDQRLCAVPDGDLFRAIRSGDVEVVTDHVEAFTRDGLRLRSGDELRADVIVTATGLEMLFIGGMELVVDGDKVDPSRRLAYKGMMLEGVPNMALVFGYVNASWTLKADLTCEYVCRILNHLRRGGLRQCVPVNEDPSMPRSTLLPLSAGYIQRAADRFPQQGDRFPWQVYQSWLADRRALRRSDLEDGAMRFTNPQPATASPVPQP